LHITDLHLRARAGTTLLGVDTDHSLRAVLAQALSEAQPDAVLVTGDIAHDPEPAVYERFAAIMGDNYSGPCLCLAGNHDVSAAMAGMSDVAGVTLPGWQVIALDSHVDDTPEADVSPEDWSRLLLQLQENQDRWVLIATHHPPVDVGCPWLDKDRIQNGGELLESLAERPNVKGMVFGHAHQVVETKYRDIPLLGTPSTCFQFAPRSAVFAIDGHMPGYRWLTLSADGQVFSEVRRLADYPLQIDPSDR
jgi:Icc protein